MLEDYEDTKFDLLAGWREVEEKINEAACVGGSCSIGGPKNSSSSNFSHSGDGTKLSSLNGMTRQQEYKTDDKEDVNPQEPNTVYKNPDERPFTAEEKYDPYWAGYYIDVKSNGYETTDSKNNKIEEMEVRVDDPLNTANDLSKNYNNMISGENALDKVTNHFEQTGQKYDIMVRVGETSKTAEEWNAEIERTAADGLPPEVPDLSPTEGGISPEDIQQNNLGSQVPFPELGAPKI